MAHSEQEIEAYVASQFLDCGRVFFFKIRCSAQVKSHRNGDEHKQAYALNGDVPLISVGVRRWCEGVKEARPDSNKGLSESEPYDNAEQPDEMSAQVRHSAVLLILPRVRRRLVAHCQSDDQRVPGHPSQPGTSPAPEEVAPQQVRKRLLQERSFDYSPKELSTNPMTCVKSAQFLQYNAREPNAN